MKKFLLLILITLGFRGSIWAGCTLPAPGNFQSTSNTSCSVTISWSPVNGATGYKVRYKLKTANSWTKVNAGNTSSYTVTGLDANTSYKFGVAAICSNNKVGTYSNTITVKTAKCTLPTGLAVSNITNNAATASWQPACSASNYVLRYKKTSISTWTKIDNISTTSYTITSLQAVTNYEVQVRSTCSADTSTWTSSVNFTTANNPAPTHPNIVMILLDDARYDAFKPNGGPSFLNYPSIDRIANEGVNFQYMCPTSSLCTPSRGTILTGLYAHKHGATFNGEDINFAIPEIQEILQDAGYFTGVIGKYSFDNNPPGCDWYAVSTAIEYTTPHFYINGKHKGYPGHVADVYTKMLGWYFDSIPANKPFFLMFWPIIPHGPTVPRSQSANLYSGNTMPFPSNFYQYSHNYPGYYYDMDHSWEFTSSQTDSMRRIEFQSQNDVDMNVDTILTRLENMGKLDSTLVIFTSDNGYIKGEHLMQAKQVALEESLRLPLFMRYPSWFQANTVVTDEIASNMDLAPTILEAANIPDTFNMDGISLHKLYTGEAQRKVFFYELCSDVAAPPLRAVRSLQYLYVYNFCNDTTEEFYDLTSDPKENTNQVFNPAYTSLLQEYRYKKDSFRVVFNDTLTSSRTCSLSNIQMKDAISSSFDDADLNGLYIFPNPASDEMKIQFFVRKNLTGTITVQNEIGAMVLDQKLSDSGWKTLQLDCSKWLPGLYFVTLKQGSEVSTAKMMVQH